MVLIMKIYSEIFRSNSIITIYVNPMERNKNTITIYNNSEGKQTYINKEVWDSDIIKLIRILDYHKYSDFKTVIKGINKVCRHLSILYFDDITLF